MAEIKVITNLTMPLGSVNPAALVGQHVTVLTLQGTVRFLVDGVRYDAEYPDQVSVELLQVESAPLFQPLPSAAAGKRAAKKEPR